MNKKIIPGTIWITGLSASGKTTLGELLYQDLRAAGIDAVEFLDGEKIRERFNHEYGYTTEERNRILEKTINFAAELNKKALGIEKGSGETNKKKVASITKAQLKEIARKKLPDLNTDDIGQAVKIIEGTARNMGIEISE